MLQLYDYGPSRNCYKVRLLLAHLGRPFLSIPVSIFAGESRTPEFLALNPMGAVPVLVREDGSVLPESNAILCDLAEGTTYLPAAGAARSEVLRWLFFEQEYVQSSVAILRYWTLTGKRARNADALPAKQALSERTLAAVEAQLQAAPFISGTAYTIADMALIAYVGRADEAGFAMADWPAIAAWRTRVASQPGFLDENIPYDVDPLSAGELG